MKWRGWWQVFLIALIAVIVAAGIWDRPSSAQQRSISSPPLRTLLQDYDPVVMPEATAYSIFTTEATNPHQVWYRISGGDALFRQRLRVYLENAAPLPQNQLPPDSALVQELTSNTPTDWFTLPVQTGIYTYYFDGDHRTTPNSPWANGRGIVVKRTKFRNGNLYELGFEDQVSLDDYNDLIIQVAFLQPT